jgi:CheY-like chemotaxis protein
MGKKVLVVEDDQAIRDVVSIVLEGEGYSVFSAGTEEEINAIIKKNPPDVILLDIWLAGLHGGSIAEKLKSREDTKHLPIVVISANTETEKVAKSSGADDFLLKPFDIIDLVTIVKKYTYR